MKARERNGNILFCFYIKIAFECRLDKLKMYNSTTE